MNTDYTEEQVRYWTDKIDLIARSVTNADRMRVAERIEGIARSILTGRYSGPKVTAVALHAGTTAKRIRTKE